MLRPFTGQGTDAYDPSPPYLNDDFEDQRITAPRENVVEGDYITPKQMAGDAVETVTRTHWDEVAGDIFPVSEEVDGEQAGRLGLSGSPGTHIAATTSTVTTGLWQVDIRYNDEDGSGEELFADLMWNPASETGWRVRFRDDRALIVERHERDGVTPVFEDEWKWSWRFVTNFEQIRFERSLDGQWVIHRHNRGEVGRFEDPWLPTAPQQFRIGTRGYGGGEVANEKQVSYVRIDTPPEFTAE